MTIFEAIATRDPHQICRTANFLDCGEAMIPAIVALRSMNTPSFVCVDNALTVHTLRTLMEVYDGEVEDVMNAISDEGARRVIRTSPQFYETLLQHAVDWYSAEYET